MSSLASVLPKARAQGAPVQDGVTARARPKCTAPPYGKRRGWAPRSQADFGDGGAYPEVHLAQYPQGMGKQKGGKTLALQVDKTGKVKYDAIAKQGHGKGTVVHTGLASMTRKDVEEDDDPTFEKPGDEELYETAEETRKALEKIVDLKVSAAAPVRAADKPGEDKYIRFTPAQQGKDFNSGSQQRIIRMVEAQVDPMEPPKFKHKKVPGGPGSPPPPVLHSPPRKVTKEEQEAFNIPPCISNWKNAKGYTIPLEKRLVDGRGLQEKEISSRFGEFTAIMNKTVKTVAEGMRVRRELENELQRKEKEQKERDLLRRAAQARNVRAGIGNVEESSSEESESEEEEAKERDDIRKERHQDRQRERRLKKASVEKQQKVRDRDKNRDISEQIALGKSIKPNTSGENMFDSRLFNQTKGMSSGFGHDDSYNVYDKPLFNSTSNSLYKAKQNDDDMIGDEDIARLKKNRFTADKQFAGTEGSSTRDGPVQFEKEEEDVFGLDALLNDAMDSKKEKKKEELGKAKTMVASRSDRDSLRSDDRKRRDRIDFDSSDRKRSRRD